MLIYDKNRPYYYCSRLRLLEFLRNKGFYPIRTIPDINNPRYNAWVFDNSPELIEAIDEYFTQQKNRLH